MAKRESRLSDELPDVEAAAVAGSDAWMDGAEIRFGCSRVDRCKPCAKG